jgi:thiol-disulfide isomerase/thioredoxin
MNNYTPVHSAGNGADNFWINFPPGTTYAGQTVKHLPWLNESFENNVVLFVVHNTGCKTCKPQADRVIALAEKYGDDVTFYDLDVALGGTTYERAVAVYLYDPNGGDMIIALTGVFTYVKDDNVNIKIGWHTWESNTVETSEMESYIKDAIYYYSVNK